MKRDSRTSVRVTRPARTSVQGLRAKLGNAECTIANVSATGAMLVTRLQVPVGREIQLLIELPRPVAAKVRVVRCEPVDVALPGAAVWRKPDFALGVHFVERTGDLVSALNSVARQAGIEQSQARILVVGKEDDISRLLDKTLADAEYKPRLLTHPRYAVTTAKRIGAKAIVINLEIDAQFSMANLIEALRADATTAPLPIVLCCAQTALDPRKKTFMSEKRVRLLHVPFTPEELVATVDRAIDELS